MFIAMAVAKTRAGAGSETYVAGSARAYPTVRTMRQYVTT